MYKKADESLPSLLSLVYLVLITLKDSIATKISIPLIFDAI